MNKELVHIAGRSPRRTHLLTNSAPDAASSGIAHRIANGSTGPAATRTNANQPLRRRLRRTRKTNFIQIVFNLEIIE